MPRAYQIRNQGAIYFLTFTIVGWADIFTRKIHRDIFIDSMKYCQKNKGLLVFAYVIMSNHIHLVCKSKNDDLSGAVRDMKRHTSKRIMYQIKSNPKERRKQWLEMILRYHAKYNKRVHDMQLWMHNNHAVEMDNNPIFEKVINYIHQNPVKAGIVESAHEYIYSSAKNYVFGKGLIEIDEL